MIKKITLIAFSSLMMIGCGDKIINGDTTVDDIKATSKVLIVTGLNTESCLIVKIGVSNNYPNGKSFITDSASCSTFNKIEGENCISQSLTKLKSDYPTMTGLQEGAKTCVVGGDKPTPK